jgi:hypothetical protein
MEVIDPIPFLQKNRQNLFYVGFLKSASDVWFPLCMVSDPEADPKLNTLFVSPSYQEMAKVVEDYAREVPQVVQTFVQYLMPEEIENLLERYALDRMALVVPETGEPGCGCGCGCQ